MSIALYRFGPFELDPAKGELCRNGTRVKLQDLPYRLLLMLLERPSEIITRDEVRQRLWPENTFVEFDNSLGVAIRKVRESLGDDADSPRYVETIPRRGYRFLAPVRTETTANIGAVLTQPPGVGTETNDTVVRNPPVDGNSTVPIRSTDPPVTRRYWPISVMVAILVGAALYVSHSPSQQTPAAVEARDLITSRRSVAVLGFRNLTGRREDNWISPAVTEMLNTELASGDVLRLVSGEDVARAIRELPLNDVDSLAKGTLKRLRNNPGADLVVLGSVTSLPGEAGKRIRLDVRLQDTARGETVSEQAFTGSEQDLFDLAIQAAGGLRRSLGVSSILEQTTAGVRASLPSNQEAARFYAEGRAKLWAFDFQGARELLIKSIAADPNYALSHSALSETFWHSGYNTKARAEARRALELSGPLSQEGRLLVQGQYARATTDWPKEVDAYQTLYRLFPDSLDYGLLLATAQIHLNAQDSLRTLDSLRRLPAPQGVDPRIDMQEASSWINVDNAKAIEAAHRAIDKATAQGSHVIVARTYGYLCQMSASTGDSIEGIRNCENALQSSVAAKDVNGEAMMQTNLAAIRFQMGDVALSESLFREAIREFRQADNLEGVATAESDLAAALLTLGELSQAGKLTEASISNYREIDNKAGVALALINLAEMKRETGNLDVAETTLQQAKATALEIDDKDALAYAFNGLADVLTDRGNLAGARQDYEQALALRTKAGEKQFARETQVSLARISIEEGHGSEAALVARTCKEQFHAEQQADDEVIASTTLVQALLAETKVPDALNETNLTMPLAAKSQTLYARLEFNLQNARVQIYTGDSRSAREGLAAILKSARDHSLVGVELKARLAQVELAVRLGQEPIARSLLTELEKSARGQGFGFILKRATALRIAPDTPGVNVKKL